MMTNAMKRARRGLLCAAASAMSAAMAVAMLPGAAQAKGFAALDAQPDWAGGVWGPDWSSLFAGRGGSGPPAGPKLTPAYAKILADFQEKKKEGQNLQTENANCRPPGMPGIMRMPYPIEFLYSPGRVTIIAETDSQVRRIYTDGRKLPDDPDPAFNGTSIGHWEGAKLVVDTVGLNPVTSLSEGLHPTENTRIHEVFEEVKPGRIAVTTTLIDPAIYAEPYTTRIDYVRQTSWEMREYICQENNRDAADPFGRPSMDISIPDDADGTEE
jgi:hypothetical protein